jgi:hypothetical protein
MALAAPITLGIGLLRFAEFDVSETNVRSRLGRRQEPGAQFEDQET